MANGRGGQQGRVNSFQGKRNCSSVATINLGKCVSQRRTKGMCAYEKKGMERNREK